MFVKNFLKNFGICAEFYQTLAKDDRQDCQNCIPGVDRNFLWNLLLRKKSPSFRVDFAWENCEFSAYKCRQSCRNCILPVKKQKKTQYDEKQVCFSEKTQFSNNFELWASSFGFLANKNSGAFSELHHFLCPKNQLEEESLIWEVFLDVLWISEQKRIRLLYKKVRQGCKDDNLNVQDVNFVYQNVCEKLSEKHWYLSRILSDFGKRRSAGLSKLHSRCRQKLFMKPFFAKNVSLF